MENFDLNLKLFNENIEYIGIDEVGYGSWAGPLFICALKFKEKPLLQFYDSKAISEKKRNELFLTLKEIAIWNIGSASVEEINNLGLAAAYKKALLSAVSFFDNVNSEFLLIDGRKPKYLNCRSIIKGDQKVQVISAASIVAKVLRDSLMNDLYKNLDLEGDVYNWFKNKGYGTKKHIEAIKKYGLSSLHRNYNLQKHFEK